MKNIISGPTAEKKGDIDVKKVGKTKKKPKTSPSPNQVVEPELLGRALYWATSIFIGSATAGFGSCLRKP